MLEDPRRVRTREALRRALLGLLEDESLASISIAALCEAAGVHRTTFYKHASSIEEFAADVITRELDAIATIDTGASDPIDAYRQAMVDVLVHVAGERELYRPLLSSRWGGALRTTIDERLRARVRIALDVFAALTQDGSNGGPRDSLPVSQPANQLVSQPGRQRERLHDGGLGRQLDWQRERERERERGAQRGGQSPRAIPDHREEIAAFISGGLVGTIVLWAQSDDLDAEGWAARVQALMPPWWPVR